MQQQGQILDAAGGLTTIEAENAFALSVVERKAVDQHYRVANLSLLLKRVP